MEKRKKALLVRSHGGCYAMADSDTKEKGREKL
jgi:hypothetical protein